MEKLFYDLSEHEFSTGRKVLLWIFSGVFILAGVAIVYMNAIQHDLSIHISFCIPPFGIGIFVAIVAYMATSKKKDHYFVMDDEKIEYRYGLVRPVRVTHLWNNISEIIMPHKEKKVLLKLKNDSYALVNLNWLERKKSHHIRKHFFYGAREKNIPVQTVKTLPDINPKKK